MTDEIDTNAPERIWAWADENDDKGWSLVPITGTMEGKPDPEYVRADLYDAERQRAERAEAERDRLREAHEENARILGYLENEMQGRVEAGKVGALSKCAERSRSALRQDKGGE